MVSQNEIRWVFKNILYISDSHSQECISVNNLNSWERTSRPKHIEYFLKTHLISICETTEWYPTLLWTMFHLVPSPSSLQLINILLSADPVCVADGAHSQRTLQISNLILCLVDLWRDIYCHPSSVSDEPQLLSRAHPWHKTI